MRFEDPRRREVRTADQAGIVGMIADRDEVNLPAFGVENDRCARDREFADAALAEAAADHDGLGVLPGLGLQKAFGDVAEFLGKILDRAMHDSRSLEIVANQNLVEFLLADLARRLVAERIIATLAQGFAPGIENLLEGALAGAVADEAVLVL